ncbi:antA/AntB antirepressor family protein [Terrisporobacter petrolearius]|uniref:antA/AntB antirepressor family protein n=1 Tax=Terrisporobacter petrolearius TaxID=1460447 RepID=UPI0031CCB765
MEAMHNIQQLVPVTMNDNEEVVISSRDLHKYLHIQTRYKVWILRMLEYGFEENEDYQRVTQKCDTPGGIQNQTDYILKIDMAKEICMIQRSERGRQARKYFIDMDKKFNSPEALIARLLQLKNKMKNQNTSQYTKSNTKTYPNTKTSTHKSEISSIDLSTNFRDTAKIIGIRENLFVSWLLLNNYCYRDASDNLKPYAHAMEYFTFRFYTTQHNHSGIQTMINSKGREVFKALLIDENVINNENVIGNEKTKLLN